MLALILIGIFNDDIFLIPPVISNRPLIIDDISSFVGSICFIRALIIKKNVIIPKSSNSVLKVLKILFVNIVTKEELLSILFLFILLIPLKKEVVL